MDTPSNSNSTTKDNTENTSGENLSAADMVREFFRLQYEGDYDQAFERFGHPDFSFVTASDGNEELTAAIPWAGYQHKGKAGYAALNQRLFGEFEVEEFEAQRYTDGADRVFVEGHFRFRHKTTGGIADSDWVARFDIADGKIVGGQFYENTYAVAKARGG